MKNKIKAAVSLLLSLLLALGCMGTSAFAADITIKSTKTGSITVVQNLNAVEQLGITGGPVAGVEYTLTQIGSLCEITYAGGYMTGYAVEKSTAEKLGIEDAANYTESYNRTKYCIYTSEATLEVLAKEIAELTTEDLKDKFSGSPTEKTDANGEAEFETLDYGLYLILQTDVSGAEYEGEPITLSHLQTPMLVSVPQSAGQSDVTVKVKTPLGYGELTKSIDRGHRPGRLYPFPAGCSAAKAFQRRHAGPLCDRGCPLERTGIGETGIGDRHAGPDLCRGHRLHPD